MVTRAPVHGSVADVRVAEQGVEFGLVSDEKQFVVRGGDKSGGTCWRVTL